MRELSLFSGAGGGLLGTHLLGWQPVGYVEKNDYCQRIIAARIRDGVLPEAPIFGDIRAFIRDGYAGAYQGMVDVITAGFPCQPFSIAGKRRGALDERNMWPATIQCIRLVRPRYALLENVPGLIVHRYFGTILRTLAESRYAASWRMLSAAECGAPHKRDRLWIVAYDTSDRRLWHRNLTAEPCEVWHRNDIDTEGQTVSNSHSDDRHWRSGAVQVGRKQESGDVTNDGIPGGTEWGPEPDVGRVADGVASRMDRLTALGNGQVPAVVRTAWHLFHQLTNP